MYNRFKVVIAALFCTKLIFEKYIRDWKEWKSYLKFKVCAVIRR